MERSSARLSVLRSALLFSPFFALSAFALGLIITDGLGDGFETGNIVGGVLFGFVTLLLGFQVVQAIRDLFSRTTETIGIVERRWSRNEFLLFRNGYIFVQNNVFRLDPETFIDVALGSRVRVVHYPHTATVESLEILSEPSHD
jgi:hypothetical protein